jgi:hypothetical protein
MNRQSLALASGAGVEERLADAERRYDEAKENGEAEARRARDEGRKRKRAEARIGEWHDHRAKERFCGKLG